MISLARPLPPHPPPSLFAEYQLTHRRHFSRLFATHPLIHFSTARRPRSLCPRAAAAFSSHAKKALATCSPLQRPTTRPTQRRACTAPNQRTKQLSSKHAPRRTVISAAFTHAAASRRRACTCAHQAFQAEDRDRWSQARSPRRARRLRCTCCCH